MLYRQRDATSVAQGRKLIYRRLLRSLREALHILGIIAFAQSCAQFL
jgi:hypothetical protein